MSGSNVLGAAIGIVIMYMLISLLCSTINEQVIARFFNLRANTLQDGIKNMLADPYGDMLVYNLYSHPLIMGLSQHAASGKPRKPSYIPAGIFAAALMSTNVVQAYKNSPDTAGSPIPEALASVMKNANYDAAQELANIEKWYNDTMDRVSGWYKRKVQLIIFALGLFIVVGLNIDTLSIVSTLISNKTQIQDLIGWSTANLPTNFSSWLLKIIGLLATVFFVTMGASIWFDILNKFISFRSDGSPPPPVAGFPLTLVGSTVPPPLIHWGIDAEDKEDERKSPSSVTGLGDEVEATSKLSPIQLVDQTEATRKTIEQSTSPPKELSQPTLSIFVSHSSKDDDFGLKLVQDLRKAFGDEKAIWYDSEGGLYGGDPWWSRIVSTLQECDIFVIVLSPNSVSSKWVMKELDIAMVEGKRIIPVLYRPCDIRPDLRTIQFISFLAPTSYEAAFSKLLQAIRH